METKIMTYEQRCPYIIGRPIENPESFFGRESLFHFIQDNLRQNVKVILLHGQRRVGKSSILKQIPNSIDVNRFVCVQFDLQNKSKLSLVQILQELVANIKEQLNLSIEQEVSSCVLSKETDFFDDFLLKVYQKIGNKNLILLLDEFDVLNGDGSSDIIKNGSGFFDYLQSLLSKKQEKLFIIPVVGRNPNDMPKLLSLFKEAPHQEITLLDEVSAIRLMTKPVQNILKYDREALLDIWKLSAGHPYFTQVICFTLFGQARTNSIWTIGRKDITDILEKIFEDDNAEAGLTWFWDGLSQPEQVVFSAVAEAQRIATEQGKGFPEDPLELLNSYGVNQAQDLTQAAQQLVKRGFLDNTGRRVTIEFVRHWLMIRHPLQQEIRKLKEEQQEVNSIPAVIPTPHKLDEKDNDLAPQKPIWIPSLNCLSGLGIKIRFSQPKLILFSSMAVVALTSSLTSINIYHFWRTPCPEGQVKRLVVSCVTDKNKISRGERTFFANPELPNDARKWGIEAFKKGDYDKAVKRFKRALMTSDKDTRQDPEVLIYYNNALARQKGSPLTLAAIAPVNKEQSSIAQEILRGVALAQDDFNRKQGLNGRLLQIAIANDTDNPEQAKQVATELVKNTSVLGVIGHYSSDATKSALLEYEQASVPIISFSTSTKLEGEVFFRTVPSDAASGKRLADYAAKDLKIQKVVIFSNPESPYSESIKQAFTDEFKRQGGQILKEIDLTKKLNANEEVENSLKQQAQAAVLFPSTKGTSAALKIAQANAEWMTNPQNLGKQGLKLLGGDTLYGDYNSDGNLSKYKEAVAGLTLAVPWFREDPKSQNFAKAASKQWGGGVSWLTAAGFDATQAFLQALRLSSNPSRKTVLEKLRQVKLPISKTSGEALQFDSKGERQSKSILVQVENGKYKSVQ